MDLDLHAQISSNYRKHTAANPIQRALIERFHRRVVQEVLQLNPKSFLDAGCGEGFVATRVLTALPGVALTGCDVSAEALDVARHANPSARFVSGSVLDLPFADKLFEVVGCFEVLEHLRDDQPRQALAELGRVASRAVVLSVPHEPFFSLANAARGKNLEVRPRGSDPDHHQFWSRKALGTLVGEQFDVRVLRGSFPWTICVAEVRDRR